MIARPGGSSTRPEADGDEKPDTDAPVWSDDVLRTASNFTLFGRLSENIRPSSTISPTITATDDGDREDLQQIDRDDVAASRRRRARNSNRRCTGPISSSSPDDSRWSVMALPLT